MNEVPLLNKSKMASRLGVSLPTLTSWIERWGDEFPIVERGRNGHHYKFNPNDVLVFIRERQEEERAKTAERDARLADLQLELGGLFPDEQTGNEYTDHSDVKKELDIWKLRDLQRKEAERCGKLLIVDEVRDNLMDVFARLSSETRSFWKRSCLRNGIPAPIVEKLLQDYGTVQKTVVANLTEALGVDSEEERQLDL